MQRPHNSEFQDGKDGKWKPQSTPPPASLIQTLFKVFFFGGGRLVTWSLYISGGNENKNVKSTMEITLEINNYSNCQKRCNLKRSMQWSLLSFTGFVLFFRSNFPGLFQDSDWIFKGSKIHINPYFPKISVLILLTAFHTLYIFIWV